MHQFKFNYIFIQQLILNIYNFYNIITFNVITIVFLCI